MGSRQHKGAQCSSKARQRLPMPQGHKGLMGSATAAMGRVTTTQLQLLGALWRTTMEATARMAAMANSRSRMVGKVIAVVAVVVAVIRVVPVMAQLLWQCLAVWQRPPLLLVMGPQTTNRGAIINLVLSKGAEVEGKEAEAEITKLMEQQ